MLAAKLVAPSVSFWKMCLRASAGEMFVMWLICSVPKLSRQIHSNYLGTLRENLQNFSKLDQVRMIQLCIRENFGKIVTKILKITMGVTMALKELLKWALSYQDTHWHRRITKNNGSLLVLPRIYKFVTHKYLNILMKYF